MFGAAKLKLPPAPSLAVDAARRDITVVITHACVLTELVRAAARRDAAAAAREDGVGMSADHSLAGACRRSTPRGPWPRQCDWR